MTDFWNTIVIVEHVLYERDCVAIVTINISESVFGCQRVLGKKDTVVFFHFYYLLILFAYPSFLIIILQLAIISIVQWKETNRNCKLTATIILK